MKKYSLSICCFLSAALILSSCKKEKSDSGDYQQSSYSLYVPDGFPQPDLTGSKALTTEGVRLGRMLYYDPILSSNGLTCASCHIQSKSFSSPYHVHPNGDHTSVPSHINLAWKSQFLWEGGLPTIEAVCMGDFEPEFFNTNMNDLVQRLKNHDQYPRLFYEAFDVADVSALSHQELKEKIVNAASQFARTLVSYNSNFDKFRRQEYAPTQEELRGMVIFNTEEGDCFHCHGSVLASDNRYHNTGLDEFPQGQDAGYYNYTYDSTDIGKFYSPTLRNIELTAPYMHDGRFETLEEVVDFYDHGVYQNSPNVDPIMTKAFKINGLHLSSYDKQCLIAYLKMYTDTTFTGNSDYGSPF